MKKQQLRLISIILSLAFLLSLVSCGKTDDTVFNWESAAAAPFNLLVPFQSGLKAEKQFNSAYSSAVSQTLSLAEGQLGVIEQLHGHLNPLEANLFELITRQNDSGHLDLDQTSRLVSQIAARRAVIDSYILTLEAVRNNQPIQGYEQAMDQFLTVYLGQHVSVYLFDYHIFLLETAQVLALTDPDPDNRELRRLIDSLERTFRRRSEDDLEALFTYQDLIYTNLESIRAARQLRQAYCFDEITVLVSDIERMLNVYRQIDDADQGIISQIETDLAWMRVIVSPAGLHQRVMSLNASNSTAAAVSLSSQQDASGETAAMRLESALEILENAQDNRYRSRHRHRLETLSSIREQVTSSLTGAPSDLDALLERRLDAADSAVMPDQIAQPARQLHEDFDQLVSAQPAPQTPVEPDSNNAVKTLDTIRHYQGFVRSMLDQSGQGGVIGFFSSLVVSRVSPDTLIDRLMQQLPTLMAGHPEPETLDQDAIMNHADTEIRRYINEQLGERWQDTLYQLCSTKAEELLNLFNAWFAQTDSRHSFLFSQDEVSLLFDLLLGRISIDDLTREDPVLRPEPTPDPMPEPTQEPVSDETTDHESQPFSLIADKTVAEPGDLLLIETVAPDQATPPDVNWYLGMDQGTFLGTGQMIRYEVPALAEDRLVIIAESLDQAVRVSIEISISSQMETSPEDRDVLQFLQETTHVLVHVRTGMPFYYDQIGEIYREHSATIVYTMQPALVWDDTRFHLSFDRPATEEMGGHSVVITGEVSASGYELLWMDAAGVYDDSLTEQGGERRSVISIKNVPLVPHRDLDRYMHPDAEIKLTGFIEGSHVKDHVLLVESSASGKVEQEGRGTNYVSGAPVYDHDDPPPHLLVVFKTEHITAYDDPTYLR